MLNVNVMKLFDNSRGPGSISTAVMNMTSVLLKLAPIKKFKVDIVSLIIFNRSDLAIQSCSLILFGRAILTLISLHIINGQLRECIRLYVAI